MSKSYFSAQTTVSYSPTGLEVPNIGSFYIVIEENLSKKCVHIQEELTSKCPHKVESPDSLASFKKTSLTQVSTLSIIKIYSIFLYFINTVMHSLS